MKIASRIKSMLLLTIVLVSLSLLSACSPSAEVSGKYVTSNKGLTFSGFEFDNGSVTLYCGGFENSHGTYEQKGSGYVLYIDDVDQDSHFTQIVEEIKENCTITVKPIDENTIETRIESNNNGEIYVGQLGKEVYERECY